MYTGLWTSTGMPHIKEEVGVAGVFIDSFSFLIHELAILVATSHCFQRISPAGTRICKTDVGWIGAGYK